jgi:multidrug resistance efflux pump
MKGDVAEVRKQVESASAEIKALEEDVRRSQAAVADAKAQRDRLASTVRNTERILRRRAVVLHVAMIVRRRDACRLRRSRSSERCSSS